MTMKIFLIALASLAALFVIVSLAAGYYMYRFAIARDKKANNLWDNEITSPRGLDERSFEVIKRGEAFAKSLEWERITIKSHDGVELVGRLYVKPDAKGIFLMAHGYRSTGIFDFSGAIRPISNLGFSLLIIDQRGHGESGGGHVCFGVKSRYDIVRWAEYLGERFPNTPVVLDGVSMGAATIMMGGEIGYPDNVRALVCDCGYTTPEAICKMTLKRWFKLPPFPVYYAAMMFVRIFAGYSFDEASSIRGVRALAERGTPILIAHGKADGFVPYSMAEELYEACRGENVELFAVDGADHGLAFLLDRDGYIEAMHRLFKKAGIE